MALPLPPNTTCDIYQTGNAPPSAPDVAAVRAHLLADYARGLEKGEGDSAPDYAFSHVLLVDVAVDVRDAYTNTGPPSSSWDVVYIPDQNGTAFRVVFVERR